MTLLESFNTLLESWKFVFAQQRTCQRAQRLAYGLLTPLRAHLTSNAICATGRQFVDWTSDYRVFSQSPWDPHALFNPVFDRLPSLLPPAAPVVLALDDTLCKKTGRHIPGATTARDPQSLPFHVNLCRGLRFVQASILVHGSDVPGPARALPVRFEPAPPATKPKWNASTEQRQAYQAEKKARALPQVGVQVLAAVRGELDARAGTLDRLLIASGDGSYTNRTVLRNLPARTVFIGRIRKNAKLCLPLADSGQRPCNGRPRRYGCPAPTPQQVLEDTSIPVTKVRCFAAGAMREMPVKVLRPLYWRNVGPDLPLQLVVIKPLGYRLRNGSKLLYREPAFLICTDPDLPLSALVQAYIDRWEIECNHRDEKSLLGVAEGQVWNPQAVTRLPQFQVALYSLLLLAAILAYGFQRTDAYLPLPRWRRKSIRPSLLDLLNLLRDQLFTFPIGNAPLAGFKAFAPPDPAPAKPTKPPLSAETLGTVAA